MATEHEVFLSKNTFNSKEILMNWTWTFYLKMKLVQRKRLFNVKEILTFFHSKEIFLSKHDFFSAGKEAIISEILFHSKNVFQTQKKSFKQALKFFNRRWIFSKRIYFYPPKRGQLEWKCSKQTYFFQFKRNL